MGVATYINITEKQNKNKQSDGLHDPSSQVLCKYMQLKQRLSSVYKNILFCRGFFHLIRWKANSFKIWCATNHHRMFSTFTRWHSLEHVAYRVEYCSTLCCQATNSTYSFNAIKEAIEILCDMYRKIESVISIESKGSTERNVVFSGAPRRPRFDIRTVRTKSKSKITFIRRLQEFSLSTNYNERDVSNDELDRETRIADREFPFYGIRRMRGYLIPKGIKMPW